MQTEKLIVPEVSPDSSTSVPADPPVSPPPPDNNEQLQPKPESGKKRRLKFSRKQLILLVIGLVVLLAGGSAVAHYTIQNKKPAQQTAASTTKKIESKPLAAISGNTFFDKPVQIDDLHFYPDNLKFYTSSCTSGDKDCIDNAKQSASAIKYYQIGTTKNGKKIVVLDQPNMGPGGDSIYYARETTNGGYEILLGLDSSYSNKDNDEQFKKDYVSGLKNDFDKKVSYNTSDTIKEFEFKQESVAQGQKLATTTDYSYIMFMPGGLKDIRGTFFGGGTASPQKIGTDGDKTIYKVVTDDKSSFKIVEIYATYKQLVSWEYFPATELGKLTDPLASSSPNALKITWIQGENNSNVYFSGGAGCGSSGYVMAKNVNPNDLIAVGKTESGQTIYQLPTSSPLAQELFNTDYSGGTDLDSSLKNLTVKQFTDKHAYFLFKNDFGEYVVYQRDDMFMRGGCAKPVIYLYPTQSTSVSVKVGADIINSDPYYPDGGWQNVLAHPDGSLLYKGKTYDSLFWEGYGHGAYPVIDQGIVVRRDQVESTLRANLKAQGLNTKESADFLAFWLPKIPNKPYVRISWLGNNSLNRLAPLNISPVPRTVIRVFLDAEGLDKPINLPAQHLIAPSRKGFTVVEWGGLLNGKLQ